MVRVLNEEKMKMVVNICKDEPMRPKEIMEKMGRTNDTYLYVLCNIMVAKGYLQVTIPPEDKPFGKYYKATEEGLNKFRGEVSNEDS